MMGRREGKRDAQGRLLGPLPLVRRADRREARGDHREARGGAMRPSVRITTRQFPARSVVLTVRETLPRWASP